MMPETMNIAGVAAPWIANMTGMPAASTEIGATAETTRAEIEGTPSLPLARVFEVGVCAVTVPPRRCYMRCMIGKN
jgi:hypothetical protein